MLQCPTVETVIVVKHTNEIEMKELRGKELSYDNLLEGEPGECECEVMDGRVSFCFYLTHQEAQGNPRELYIQLEDILGVSTTLKNIFDIQPDDTYWCTADIGWITGHSYLIYGPLLLGTTTVVYEGAPDYPDPGAWWKIIEKYGITKFYTAPTAIRHL